MEQGGSYSVPTERNVCLPSFAAVLSDVQPSWCRLCLYLLLWELCAVTGRHCGNFGAASHPVKGVAYGRSGLHTYPDAFTQRQRGDHLSRCCTCLQNPHLAPFQLHTGSIGQVVRWLLRQVHTHCYEFIFASTSVSVLKA